MLLDDESPEEDSNLPTLSSLSPSSRFRPPTPEDKPTPPVTPSSSSPPSIDPKAPSPTPSVDPSPNEADPSSPEGLEEEAHQQGAFNEETGEINWDCPCLGGMAHGPCGEEFRAAFSCFVYSTEQPKGMDCIDRFKGMQDCFRQHPDVYGAELDEEDEEAAALENGAGAAATPAPLPEDAPGTAAAKGILANHEAASTPAAEDSIAAGSGIAAAQPVTEGSQANLRERAATQPVTGAVSYSSEKKSIYDSEDERGTEPSPGGHDVGKQSKMLKDSDRTRSSAHPAAGEDDDELVPKAAHDATSSNKK